MGFNVLDNSLNKKTVSVILPGAIPKKEPSFLPIYSTKVTSGLAKAIGKNFSQDKITREYKLDFDDVSIVIAGEIIARVNKNKDILEARPLKLIGVSTHKLLCFVLALFTKTGDRNIAIPVKEFAMICEEYTPPQLSIEMSDEERKKIKATAKSALNNFSKKVKKDINLLSGSVLRFEYKGDSRNRPIFSIADYERGGRLVFKINEDIIEYLKKSPINQLSTAIFSMDERNQNAYFFANLMLQHYNIDNNLRRGTSNILAVKSLLKNSNLPDINSTAVKKNSWRVRIKEPFENALEAAVKNGVITIWRYTNSKGIEISDEEMTKLEAVQTFEEWQNMLIYFVPVNPPDHTQRLKANSLKIDKKQSLSKSRAAKQ